MEQALGHEYAEEASRSIHKMSVAGARAVQFDRNSSTGEWLALVCIDRERLVAAARKTAKNVAFRLAPKYKERHQELISKMDEKLKKAHPEVTSN